LLVHFDQLTDRFGADHWHVTAENDNGTTARQRVDRGSDRSSGAVGLRLDDDLNIVAEQTVERASRGVDNDQLRTSGITSGN
jgi:hypothetical protein